MPDKAEKARRKEVKRTIREDARRKVRDSLPVPVPVLKAFFDYLDQQLESTACDNTLRHTQDFIRDNGASEEVLVRWRRITTATVIARPL